MQTMMGLAKLPKVRDKLELFARDRPDETREYIWGQCRNDPYARAHLYEVPPGQKMNALGPMCIYGWNREDGHRMSILRNVATGPRCQRCEARAAKKLGWVDPKTHKTKWL
jgi:hypothetical protein